MRRWIGTTLAATVLAMLTMVPGARAQSASPAGDVVLRVGETADLISANPYAVSAGSDWTVVTGQYDMLMKFSDEDLSPAPSLATGCTPSTDHLTWTCKLRPGLKWSDGQPLTSADVKFSYQFVIDHKIPQYRSYFSSDPVFETPDESTFIWKTDAPSFAFDMPPWVYVVPEHVWSQYDGDDLKTIKAVENVPSVVSGPFQLTAWDHGQGWTMTRNPNFWGPTPTIDRIEFSLYTNQEAMAQALKNGEIDVADGLTPGLYKSVQKTPNIVGQEVISDWWLNLAFNFGGQGPNADPLPALHDITVRKAIQMAIDKQAIVDKVYQGTADPGDTIIRQASTYWHLDIPAAQEIPFDPPGANDLLDQAGYVDTNGDGVREDPKTGDELRLRIPASQDTTGAVDAGQLIVGFLKEIGIAVDLQPVTDAKMNDFWAAGNFDAYIWYWSGDPDPNYQLFVYTSAQCGAWEDGCWKDPTFDALYEEQAKTMDREARLSIVQQAQQEAYDQIPSVVLAYPSLLQAYRSDRFTGWTPSPGANGYLLSTYNYDSLLSAHPVVGAAPSSSPSLPPAVWIVLLVVVVVVVIAALRRRRTSDDET
ncbi:MAG: peptide/nickel transport system substrate-binding protein [Actinomycetota bacterium]|jgi:peptide/nickel transport system substrate-binding protein|nr:peptide/nickel transport system substrate-binding protein [Actinomycetota bacterium]